jgi:hypothetical protein
MPTQSRWAWHQGASLFANRTYVPFPPDRVGMVLILEWASLRPLVNGQSRVDNGSVPFPVSKKSLKFRPP